jgi:Kef-type K+ transport system membrane component KefB/mannitol/fructose-specific phosphotransferase system IIA component (Ntr-type)
LSHLTAADLTIVLLALGLLVGVARLFGELARRFRQPAVLGEILAGVLLGPTVLGTIAPSLQSTLFPTQGPVAILLDGIASLSIVLFLLVAGMEVDLSVVWRQGRAALKVGLLGTVIPFVIGLGAAWFGPRAFGIEDGADPLVFALFVATAMSISALPVIAKTLMDLNLYRTDLGMIVVSAAIFNDLVGWTVFAIILGMIGASAAGFGVGGTVALTLLFAGVMLTVGRAAVHRVLPILQAYTHWPGGVLGFAVTLALLGAAFTEWIGIHAIFGAFIVGVALGDSTHLQERTRSLLDEFVAFVFAPVFLASIGLRVNFITQFDGPLVLRVLALACACKLLGAVLGARWGGSRTRESWAIGFAMNARGAMEIILGLLALRAGIIHQELFVALVVMAIVTSAMSGPLMTWILKLRPSRKLTGSLSPKLFVRNLTAESRLGAISELATLAAEPAGMEVVDIEAAAWKRETIAATGIGNGIAVPHARIPRLKQAVVVVGLSEAGIPFDAPDGQNAHVVFLMLTPAEDPSVQLELSANVSRIFREPQALVNVRRAANFTEFLAALKMLEPAEAPAVVPVSEPADAAMQARRPN